MSEEIVFYTNPMSRGRTVRWTLEEIGAPYRTEIMQYGPAMKTSEFLAINPMGKIPALRHGKAVVTETAAICAYLADAFPAAGLAPAPGDPRRAAYYRWLFFGAGTVEAAVLNTAAGFVLPDDKKGMAGYGSMQLTLDTVETAIGASEYLAGDIFTTADIFMASLLGWTMHVGIVEKRPAFQAYAHRMFARPAAARAKQIDDALMPPPAA